jgi:hypothetical protein
MDSNKHRNSNNDAADNNSNSNPRKTTAVARKEPFRVRHKIVVVYPETIV